MREGGRSIGLQHIKIAPKSIVVIRIITCGLGLEGWLLIVEADFYRGKGEPWSFGWQISLTSFYSFKTSKALSAVIFFLTPFTMTLIWPNPTHQDNLTWTHGSLCFYCSCTDSFYLLFPHNNLKLSTKFPFKVWECSSVPLWDTRFCNVGRSSTRC